MSRWMTAGVTALFLLFAPAAHALPKVQEVKTEKGLTAWLVENHDLPMVSLRLVFPGGGAAYHPETAQGLPVYAMQMLTEGAGDLDSEAYNARLQDHAISLSFNVDQDNASISVNALSEEVEEGLRLMALAIAKPRLEEDDMARVGAELQNALRLQEQSPNYVAERRFREALYGTHPYAKATLGTESSLKKVTAQGIRQYVKQAFHRDGVIVSVAGDITPAQLKTLLDAHVATLPVRTGPAPALAAAPIPTQTEPLIAHAPFPQAVTNFALPGIARDDKDFYAAYLMNHILGGGGMETRLTDEVRRKHGLTYSVYSGLVMDDASNLWRGGMATDAAKARDAIRVVREVVKSAYDKGFTQDELDRAKSYITGSFPLDIDANTDLVNYLTVMQLKKLGIDYLDQRNALMEAVTLDDVNRVAHRLLTPDHLVFVAIGEMP